MMISQTRPGMGTVLYFVLVATLSVYFGVSAIQGEDGVLRQIQIADEAAGLRAERDRLMAELDGLKNLTHRLSDSYLDVDLLDEQVRDVLGYVRADEIVIR